MVWMLEFLQTACRLHFRKDGLKPNRKVLMQMSQKGGMNCFLQMVLTTGLTVSLPTAQTGGMTNRMKRPVTYDLKYCSKTSVPK
jgi:phosphatidylglycerophosphate synthase